jgi:hypothetical protein
MAGRAARFETSLLTACLVAALTIWLPGCGAGSNSPTGSGGEPAVWLEPEAAGQRLAAGVDDLRFDLLAGGVSVKPALESLNALAAAEPDGLPPAFRAYVRDLADLEAAAEQVTRRAAHVEDAREEYLSRWSRDLQTTRDASTSPDAQQRRVEIDKGLDAVATALQDAAAAYRPFVQTLKQVRSALEHDLTPGAVAGLTPQVEQASAEGQRVRERVALVIAEVDRVSGRPKPPPASPDWRGRIELAVVWRARLTHRSTFWS